MGLPDNRKVKMMPDLSSKLEADIVNTETVLGRVFRTGPAAKRVLVYLTTDGEAPLLQKFIIPCTGLDMPIFKL